jgi:hypothetical protein
MIIHQWVYGRVISILPHSVHVLFLRTLPPSRARFVVRESVGMSYFDVQELLHGNLQLMVVVPIIRKKRAVRRVLVHPFRWMDRYHYTVV